MPPHYNYSRVLGSAAVLSVVPYAPHYIQRMQSVATETCRQCSACGLVSLLSEALADQTTALPLPLPLRWQPDLLLTC